MINETSELCPQDLARLRNWTYDAKRVPLTLSNRVCHLSHLISSIIWL